MGRPRRSRSTTSGRPPPTVDAGTLSGGNQQKAVVAREFSRNLRVLVLDQPTRGLDVGSIEFIHRQAISKRDAGTAILLVSAELDEVMELSDRIAVMYRGELVALVDGPTANREDDRPADGDRRPQGRDRGRPRHGHDRVTAGAAASAAIDDAPPHRGWSARAVPVVSILLALLVGGDRHRGVELATTRVQPRPCRSPPTRACSRERPASTSST